MKDQIHIEKLPNAPLKEVVFEMHWKLDVDKESGLLLDRDFPLASGKFDSLANQSLTFYERLVPDVLPYNFFSHKAIHRYWKSANEYPVMQLGPGLFTVNDTEKKYVWKDFKKTIFEGIKWLRESYRDRLNLDFIELHYIDAVQIPDDLNVLPDFFKKSLKININNNIPLPSNKFSGFQLIQKYKLENGNNLNLVFNNAEQGVENILVWRNSISKQGGIKMESLEAWVEDAHTACSLLFKNMISEELYEQFKRKN